MGILAFLQSGVGFFLKPVKFGGGGPLLVWLLAIFGAYSMVTGSMDTVKGWLGVSDEQIIAEQKATIELYGNANADLSNTVEIAIATQENADTVISETYDKVQETGDAVTKLTEEKERKLEELGTIIPIIQYESDIADHPTEPVVVKEETVEVPDAKPESKPVTRITVTHKEEPKPQAAEEPEKKPTTMISAYVVNKKLSEESAQINIDALWTAYRVTQPNNGGSS